VAFESGAVHAMHRRLGGPKTHPVSSLPSQNRACGSPAHGSPPCSRRAAFRCATSVGPAPKQPSLRDVVPRVISLSAIPLPHQWAAHSAGGPSLRRVLLSTPSTLLWPPPTPAPLSPVSWVLHLSGSTLPVHLSGWHPKGLPPQADWGGDGSLLFRDGLCARSAPHTPAGSWVLLLQVLRTVHGLRHQASGSAPACPLPEQGGGHGAAGFLVVRTVHSLGPQRAFVVALRRSDLSVRRPPATGLLGHYPDRTYTGKSITASQDTRLGPSFGRTRTG